MKNIIFAIVAVIMHHSFTFASSLPTDVQFSNLAKSMTQDTIVALQRIEEPKASPAKKGQPAKENSQLAEFRKSRLKLNALEACTTEARERTSPAIKFTKYSKCTIMALYDNLKDVVTKDLLAQDPLPSSTDENVLKAQKFCLASLANQYNSEPCKVKGRTYWEQAKTATTSDGKITNYMKCYFITGNHKCSANNGTGICVINPS